MGKDYNGRSGGNAGNDQRCKGWEGWKVAVGVISCGVGLVVLIGDGLVRCCCESLFLSFSSASGMGGGTNRVIRGGRCRLLS